MSEDCPKCLDGTHPFSCFICEHPGSMDFYRSASIQYICGVILGIKLCNTHAKELDELQQKKEIEKSVA